MKSFSDQPFQRLDPVAYTDPDWFKREEKIVIAKSWQFACMSFDLPDTGDYLSLKIAGYPIFVIRTADGELAAKHNICRHRGTELLEGKGNAGKTIVCPYHRWTYGLDGQLRGVPDRAECFPDMDRAQNNLFEVGLGEFKEMVFVNLADSTGNSFEDWIGPLRGHEWPHEISVSKLTSSEAFVYDLKCNWKVFYENAIDGYHLAYLHEKTLGGPVANKNTWKIHGENLVWYSTERDGLKNRIPKFVEEQAKGSGMKKVPGAHDPGYGGVYMLFPTTLVTPSPWSLTISAIRPIEADRTLIEARTWVPDSWFGHKENPSDAPGFDPETKTIRSDKWTVHPLETGDFQTEDIWVCEKMQRSLTSPKYAVGRLARGSGGEAPLEFFQQQILNRVQKEAIQ